jgi:hypothetical protein
VIARVWSARATRELAPQYAEYLHDHVFAELGAINGYESGMLLQRQTGNSVELQVITWWRSLASIRAFAGDEVDKAVVTDRAASMLLDYDRHVRHYEVLLQHRRDG